MAHNPDLEFETLASSFGINADSLAGPAGLYKAAVIDGASVFLSGQIPKVGNEVVVSGKVGSEVSLEDAKRGAAIAAIRLLAVLKDAVGSLANISAVTRVNVFVQCAEGFAQQTQVADAASGVLQAVLGEAAGHARTAVGVAALPRNASVEVDLMASLKH
ncbi:RidA family protein [Pseudomonas lurida]|uniref:RidA family protein n=1 Tax=Pseudomonas TaxID=286 RepID=UPI0015E48B60|nr:MULTISPECIES: RidA family protein [Pseudomonas]MBA1292461.1 RidA family protein [Pseudomonas lurida]